MKILIVLTKFENNFEILAFSRMFADQTEIPLTVMMVVRKKTAALLENAEKSVAQAKLQINLPDVETKIRVGDICDQVNQEVDQGNYDLVIIGERVSSYLDRWVHRFPAVAVAEHVPCSVIIFKGQARPIQRMLLCDSGAGKSTLLSRFTAEIAHVLPGSEVVTILHVMSQISAGPGISGRNLRASTEELIEEHTLEGLIVEADMQNLESQGIEAKPMVRHGMVVDEILAEARSGDYDLVIVGAHDYQPPRRFLLENIAKQILKKVDKPILVVRSPGNTAPEED
jgi:nucleotide-binding universal stress UspA family protein